MGELLQQTLDLYSEPWKKHHDEVMKNYDTADAMSETVSFGVFLFERLLKKLDNDGTAKVQAVEPALKAISNWYNATSHVLAKVEEVESEEFEVQGSRKLKEHFAQSYGIIEDLLDAKRAIESVRSKTALPLDAYLNELRNPPNR